MIKAFNGHLNVEDYIRDLPEFLSFRKGLLKAADYLGRHNVIVRIYGRSRLMGGDSVTDCLQACDIQAVSNLKAHGELANPSINTITSKILSDPRLVEQLSGNAPRVNFWRNFFGQERFSSVDKIVLFDSKQRLEIMERYKADNALLSQEFLTVDEAKMFELGDKTSNATLCDNDGLLTYGDVVELIRAIYEMGPISVSLNPIPSAPSDAAIPPS